MGAGAADTSLLRAVGGTDDIAGASLERSYRDGSHETRDRSADAVEHRFALVASVCAPLDIGSLPLCLEASVIRAESSVHVRDGGLAEPGSAYAAVPAEMVLRECHAHSGAPPVRKVVDAVVVSCQKYCSGVP